MTSVVREVVSIATNQQSSCSYGPIEVFRHECMVPRWVHARTSPLNDSQYMYVLAACSYALVVTDSLLNHFSCKILYISS